MAKSIKLNSDLWQRVEQHAKEAGYSSPQEFVEHLLEKELAKYEDEQSRQEVDRRLKGLGYLD
jgi:metal-responsive CopG/Arc/MetJ family transcriptional regulator